MKFLLLAGIASLAISHAAQAAIITVSPATSGGSQINITGELERGDEIQFTEVAQNATQGIVNFNSPGGNTISAIAIGRLIRTYGFNTIVGNDATCTSACALAWLAGNVRYVTPDSRVGFHATYVKDNDGTPNITGGGNAMVGGYLQELGLSPSAIVALNSPGPNDIYWLQPADAAKLGIAVTVINPTPVVAAPARPAWPTPPAAPATPPVWPATPPGAPPAWPPSPDRQSKPVVPDPNARAVLNTYWERLGDWIQVASRDNFDDAKNFATYLANQYGQFTGPVYVFKNKSTAVPGGFVIALGPIPHPLATQTLQDRFNHFAIPPDSMIVSGRHFGAMLWSPPCPTCDQQP